MKLEIDIDGDYYKIICKRVEENKPYHSPYEYEVIADGKPIEQEPTDKNFTKADLDAIVKAINEGWELRVNEILSKIRAEIEQLPTTKCTETRRIYIDADDFKENVLAILDKYKAETEVEDGHDD